MPAGIGVVGLGGELLDAEHVVDELGRAVLDVEGPAAESATLGDDHPVGSTVGDLDLGGDGERLVLDADHAVLRQPSHAGEEQLRVAADQRRSPGQLWLDPFGDAVVDRHHVVLGGFTTFSGISTVRCRYRMMVCPGMFEALALMQAR